MISCNDNSPGVIKCYDGSLMCLRDETKIPKSQSFLVDYWCLAEGSKWEQLINITIIVYCSILTGVLIYYLYLSTKKLEKVTKYNKYDVVANMQTYCIFTAM